MKLPHFIKCNYSVWSQIVNCYTAPYQFKYCKQCNKIVKRRVTFTSNEVNLAVWNHKMED
jgi:NAD-dependent SIR2 family protein deacetylase